MCIRDSTRKVPPYGNTPPWSAIPLSTPPIACSRTPKCTLRPPGVSFWNHPHSREPHSLSSVLFEGARSAEPPIRVGAVPATAFSTLPEADLVACLLYT